MINLEGNYVCGRALEVRSFVISFPYFLPRPCFLLHFSHLESPLCYCIILGLFRLHADSNGLSSVYTMSSIACHFILEGLLGPVSPFSAPLTCVELGAYFSTVGSSQVPTPNVTLLSEGEEILF